MSVQPIAARSYYGYAGQALEGYGSLKVLLSRLSGDGVVCDCLFSHLGTPIGCEKLFID